MGKIHIDLRRETSSSPDSHKIRFFFPDEFPVFDELNYIDYVSMPPHFLDLRVEISPQLGIKTNIYIYIYIAVAASHTEGGAELYLESSFIES